MYRTALGSEEAVSIPDTGGIARNAPILIILDLDRQFRRGEHGVPATGSSNPVFVIPFQISNLLTILWTRENWYRTQKSRARKLWSLVEGGGVG